MGRPKRLKELELLATAHHVLAAVMQAAAAAARPALPRHRVRLVWSRLHRGARARPVSPPGPATAGGMAPMATRPRCAGDGDPMIRGAMLAAFFAGFPWWPHAVAQNSGGSSAVDAAAGRKPRRP